MMSSFILGRRGMGGKGETALHGQPSLFTPLIFQSSAVTICALDHTLLSTITFLISLIVVDIPSSSIYLVQVKLKINTAFNCF